MGQASIRLLDELDAGCFVVRAPVRGVAVLIRIEVAMRLPLVAAARLPDCAVAAVHRISEHQLGAVNLQQALPFGGDVRRDAQHDAIPARRADHRVGNAGIAGGRIEQDPVPAQRSGTFTLSNHRRRRAILHRSAGVMAFQLRVELDAGTDLEAPQADEGRAPDKRPQRRNLPD